MTKSVLVIDTPTQAYECPLDDRGYCQVKRDMCIFWEGIECPLKPMPQRCGSARKDDEVSKLIALGWNACIDYLEGKEDEIKT